jgi:hypothetical protein
MTAPGSLLHRSAVYLDRWSPAGHDGIRPTAPTKHALHLSAEGLAPSKVKITAASTRVLTNQPGPGAGSCTASTRQPAINRHSP